MKKTLIALAVLGATAGVAHAQSNVTVYGMLDTGYVKETGKSTRMDENHNSRLGFRGSEDLGNGLKGTFELEARMNVGDGTEKASKSGTKTGRTWDGASNVGLASSWGNVRFGRMNELPTESYRRLDPFNQDGVAAGYYSSQRSARISNTVRYDSPNISGFKGGLSYTLSRDGNDVAGSGTSYTSGEAKDARNHGYAVSLNYDNGPILLLANWSRLADSNSSSVWNLGAAYSFGDIKVSLGYERTKDKGWKGGSYTNQGGLSTAKTSGIDTLAPEKQDNWIVGFEWKLGPGVLGASYNRSKMKGAHVSGWNDAAGQDDSLTANQYAIGYTYNLSKRTSVYANYAHNSYDSVKSADFYGKGTGDDSSNAYQVGITHKF